jgi:hypothetical protein
MYFTVVIRVQMDGGTAAVEGDQGRVCEVIRRLAQIHQPEQNFWVSSCTRTRPHLILKAVALNVVQNNNFNAS